MSGKNWQHSLSRRNLLKLGAGAIGTGALIAGAGTLTAGVGSQMVLPEPAVAQNNMTPDDALEMLMAGNKRFVERKRENPNQTFARLTEVAKSQAPFAAILGCADSRVTPEIIFDRGIGDLFVVRVAGNVATVEDIGSEEFATLVLGSKVLMVLGHERCGAVEAAIKGGEVPGLIGTLIHAIKPAVDATEGRPGDRIENAVKANVLLQVKQLQTSPVISKLIQEGKLKVVGGYYDLDTGTVSVIS